MKKVILVVDDEYTNYLLIKESLNKLPIIIILARNGIEAVEYTKNNPEIVLILMDLRMPEMDGFYAAKLIKSLRPDLPIIAQTAFFYDNIQDRLFDGGFSDYLRKPFGAKELINCIKKQIDLTE